MTNEIIVLGGGCFWCLEPIFNQIKGIEKVQVGYTGGHAKNPTYEEVSAGQSGHAEVALIEFNPKIISLDQLLEIFFFIHDPTSLNRQGRDIGEQYRSAIFYTKENQKQKAQEIINNLITNGIPVVTQLEPLKEFYPSEDYHQNYYEQHKDAPYCQIIISPKLQKFKEKFRDILKSP
jgi:peptide-methionine (S)-S-oxide reductase